MWVNCGVVQASDDAAEPSDAAIKSMVAACCATAASFAAVTSLSSEKSDG